MDFSQDPDLDPIAQALHPIAHAATKLGLEWMLIGAVARDLLLLQAGAAPSRRRTLDVDIAVCIETWEQHEALTSELIQSHGAVADTTAPQRLHLASGMPIDIVPFGAISPDSVLRWPPDGEWTLAVTGFAEALDCSSTLILPGHLEIRTVSVHHLLALKLLAWSDRHLSHPGRDAPDIALLLERATDFVALDDLHDQHAAILEQHDWDPDLAAIQVMGRRLRGSLRQESLDPVIRILQAETLVTGPLHLVRELRLDERALPCLLALEAGIESA